jgi:hypothetical protein
MNRSDAEDVSIPRSTALEWTSVERKGKDFVNERLNL